MNRECRGASKCGKCRVGLRLGWWWWRGRGCSDPFLSGGQLPQVLRCVPEIREAGDKVHTECEPGTSGRSDGFEKAIGDMVEGFNSETVRAVVDIVHCVLSHLQPKVVARLHFEGVGTAGVSGGRVVLAGREDGEFEGRVIGNVEEALITPGAVLDSAFSDGQ